MNESPPDRLLPSSESLTPRWRWWVHFVLLAGYVLGVGLMGLTPSGNDEPMLPRNARGLLIIAGFEMAIFATVFGLAWLASRPSRDDLLLRWRGGLKIVPLCLGYSIALRLGLALVMFVIGVALVASGAMSLDSIQELIQANQPRTESLVDASALRADPLYFLLLLTVISFVVAGLREELWRSAFLAGLRGLGPRYFGSPRGEIAGVAIAAVVFGVGHLSMGPLGAFMAGVLGFGLGIIMLLHRSIWPAVLAHGLFDATTFGLLRWIEL